MSEAILHKTHGYLTCPEGWYWEERGKMVELIAPMPLTVLHNENGKRFPWRVRASHVIAHYG